MAPVGDRFFWWALGFFSGCVVASLLALASR